jgi:hypothetical protein
VIEKTEEEMIMGEPKLMDFSNYDIGQNKGLLGNVKTNPQTIQFHNEGFIYQREF